MQRPKFRGSLVRAAWGWARDAATAILADINLRLQPGPTITGLRDGVGSGALRATRSLVLYVHYAPAGLVSEMVHDQIEAYRRLGFLVVFITMASELSPAAMTRLAESCALIVRRRNHGLDFGAWHDVAPIVRARAPHIDELLLVNDSVCGPLRPLEPVFAAFRAAGNGLFGLSESLAPRPHLQSYCLLIRGQAAIADALCFLEAFRPSSNKRRTIRKGEVALTPWMDRRGHAVRAFCGYDRVERAALGHSVARERVRTLYPWRFAGAADENDAMCRALTRSPLNATHLFWRELIEDFGFPFVKTDLLLRNPLGISDRLDWRSVLPSLIGDRLGDHIVEHLAQFGSVGEPPPHPPIRAWGRAVAVSAGVVAAEVRYRYAQCGRVQNNGALVSVIMPVRDRPGALLEAIASVLAQVWTRFELLVIDDGSVEDVAGLVASRFDDVRIRVLRQEPTGVSAARNLGLRHASGELIAYLDSDNLWHPGYLIGLTREFERRPLSDCAYGIMATKSHGRRRFLWDAYDRSALEAANLIDLNVFAHRRTLFERLGGFDEALSRLVDWDLILRYTEEKPPARLAIWGATYRVLDTNRISDIVPLADSMANVRRKLACRQAPDGLTPRPAASCGDTGAR